MIPAPGLRVLGLLGGVGCGKTTVARKLAAELPAEHLDADATVAELLRQPELGLVIEKEFGQGLRDAQGGLDRAALGALIFADEEARKRLEELLHPRVRQAFYQRLAAWEARPQATWVVLDVPLLLEGGLAQVCDWLLFIEAEDSLRCARACRRHGWDQATWRAREQAQWPLSKKREAADAILCNGSDPQRLALGLQELLPTIRALLPRPLRDRWPHWDQAPNPRSPS